MFCFIGVLTLIGHQLPTKLLFIAGLGGEDKTEKTLMGQHKGSLINWKIKKNKRFYSLLPISRQRLATSQGAELQYQQQLLWNTNVINKECCPFVLLSLSCYCWAGATRYGISFWSLWASCRGCVPAQFVALPQPIGEEEHVGERMWAFPSNGRNTGMAATPLQLPVQRTAPWGLPWENGLHVSQTQYTLQRKQPSNLAIGENSNQDSPKNDTMEKMKDSK